MPIKFYNTLSGKKEAFTPLKGKNVSMHVCGITPYNFSHIGHARPAITSDLVKRLLKRKGFKVKLATNYTDIDDKIIKKAIEQEKDFKEIANEVIMDYEQALQKLNVLKADAYPKATHSMNEIIAMIESIIQNGYAYEA